MLSKGIRLWFDKIWFLEVCGCYIMLKCIVENVLSKRKPENFLTVILGISNFFLDLFIINLILHLW